MSRRPSSRSTPQGEPLRAVDDSVVAAAPLDGVRVASVSIFAVDPDLLLGRYVDQPAPGDGAHELVVSGWVVPRQGPAALVELVAGGRTGARATVSGNRKDVERRFPDVPWASAAGFRARVEPPSDVRTVSVDAVLTDGRRARIAEITLESPNGRADRRPARMGGWAPALLGRSLRRKGDDDRRR